MEVAVTVAKVIIVVFVVIVTICEKIVGIGSVMDNYVGCDSSCNSYNIG